MRKKQYRVFILYLVLVTSLIQACGSVPKRNALPEELSVVSEIPGVPMAKYWGDVPSPYAIIMAHDDPEILRQRFPAFVGKPFKMLAISGGGANGAFGAGLLAGWTEAGTRPQFSVVTGISTGALTAPFAFLGSSYDHVIREVYTTTTTEDIVNMRSTLQTITSDAAGDTAPLRALIAKHVNEEVVEKIADEYRQGRLLLVGTTNLDAMRPVTWNIGEIAISGAPGALELIHDVLLASASIPVAFPPVMIGVEAEGQQYDEMHVDGGASRQSFLVNFGVDFNLILDHLQTSGRPSAYVIRNAWLAPKWKEVDPKLMTIAGRTVSSLTRTQGLGDLYREYLSAEEFEFDYNLAYIPDDFEAEMTEGFDPVYMKKLFDLGFTMAREGYPWSTTPPGVESH